MNPVLESLFKHKSIRKYKEQPLEDEKLQLIIKAAQAAPTWCNGEQVSIIAIKDKARKELFQKLCWDQKYISTCSVFLVFCSDYYRMKLAFEKAGKTNEIFEKYIKQLDTESMGLGTVDIGAIRTKCLEVSKELNLPKYVIPVIGLCVGYPDDNPGIKPRIPMSGVFFEDKYDVEKAKDGVNEYDNIFKKYLSERDTNSRDSDWSKSISNIYENTLQMSKEDYPLLKQQGYITIENKEN